MSRSRRQPAGALLDPRDPLVVDTRPLGRRPGTMRPLERTAPAPALLGSGLVHVPEGAEIELHLRLESVMEGVLVSGSVRAPLAGECARCLEPVTSSVDVALQQLYAYDAEGAGEDDDVELLHEDLLDLQPALRDAVVLALPLSPTCRPDCAGLCPECGTRLDDDPGHAHEAVDPRWEALRGLTGDPSERG